MLIPEIPEVPEEEQTPTVKALLFLIHQLSRIAHELSHRTKEQAKELERLKAEITKLKGQKGPPKIRPSKNANGAKGKAAKESRYRKIGQVI